MNGNIRFKIMYDCMCMKRIQLFIVANINVFQWINDEFTQYLPVYFNRP